MIGSLFSGVGGLELGLEWAGLGPTVWQVEQNPFCLGVLEKDWPEAKRYDDVCTVGSANLARVNLICGGFPCTDLSRIGARKGLTGSRSGLWLEYHRIVKELLPEWVVVENIANGEPWVDDVRAGLGELGYETLPVPLSAADVGAPHERPRVFIIARDPNGYREPVGAEHAQVAELCSSARRFPGWSTRPDLSVADGVPREVGMKAFGNAVVPACSEVIGWMIRETQDD